MPRPALALLAVLFATSLAAQTTRNTCVEVSATVQVSPPQITFTWPADATATGYSIYRRAPLASSWGSAVASLGAGATTWTDTTIAVGQAYEYRFDKAGSPIGRGYCQAGINVPATHSRGKLILIVANTVTAYLAAELTRLEQDLIGDGWQVIRHDVAPAATVPSVKALIVADYAADTANVKAVLLFGAVPVPYSGNQAWDGHSNHQGAWPCDAFYGDMNGTWTDTTVNNTTPSRAENDNIPGDGKYDQSVIPSTMELMVGRVDLSNMPAFTTAEQDLLKNYLNKHHDFRHRVISCAEQAVVDDNFGYFSGEAFAASGWRNFAPMFGAANTTAADYFTTLNTASGPGYLWSYGCGGGTYTSAGGVGSTTNFTTSTNRNIFTVLFGSYHGDWGAQDNFMRASLCSGWTLTCAWAGRPAWSFWHMALGETIGYSTRWSQNDTQPLNSFGARGCHMGLMGDPTLRLHTITPASAFGGTVNAGAIDLTWTASPDTVLGYHVYRASAATGPYTLLNATPVTGVSYSDAAPLVGDNFYMVRAVALQTSGSGTYNNLSQGVFTTVNNPLAAPTITTHPTNQTVDEGLTAMFSVSATGSGTLSYQWQRNGTDISGATSSSYTTPPTLASDNGAAFRCVVTNSGGSTTSNAATLTVTPAGTGGGNSGGGGGDGGGCSTGEAATWAALCMVAVLASLIRRRRAV